MATVVQSICPRCQKTLRIPSEWVNQPLRCKHCGQTFQARAIAPDPKPAPPSPGPAVTNSPKPLPRPAPGAVVVAPVAAYHPPQAGNDLFGGINDPDKSPLPRSYRRRYAAKNSQGKWILLLTLLLLGGGVGGFLAWYSSASRHDSSLIEKSSNPTRGRITKDELKDTTPVPPGTQFPRRALIVSVHNYLYANLVHGGNPGETNLNVSTFQRALTNALRIPLPQILHLSDEAGKGKKRTPLKPVIQETIHKFLAESRAQDRILLFFIGHAVEIENQGFLVPIEGELDNPSTLIPLKWFFDELEQCPARQKVLVLDVARLSPTYGLERPAGGPLSPKFEALLQNPPRGSPGAVRLLRRPTIL